MKLDFNNEEIQFKEKDIEKYNLNTIEKNIEEFRRFTYQMTLNVDFDEIYNSMVFQMTFYDNSSNYLDNLLVVYNAIASNKIVGNKIYPQIDEESFITQMKLRGWECYKTKLTISKNEYRFVKRFRKSNALLWD